MGMDMYPDPMFSIAHLFVPSNNGYSSVAIDGGAAIAQGVFIPDSVHDLFHEDEISRIYLDESFKLFFRVQEF